MVSVITTQRAAMALGGIEHLFTRSRGRWVQKAAHRGTAHVSEVRKLIVTYQASPPT